MALHRTANRGWLHIALYVAGHNIRAAGQRTEPLCGAVRRWRRAHPILVPAVGAGLYLHVMGYLPPRADPLHWLGVGIDWCAELMRKCRRPRR